MILGVLIIPSLAIRNRRWYCVDYVLFMANVSLTHYIDGCQIDVEIPAQRQPETSTKVAQLAVSSIT